MTQEALQKIDAELKAFKGANKETAVKTAVAAALRDFVKQDEEFAQAVVQCDKKLSDCCAHIMKGVGNSISDNEVYKRAAQFYFPGADVFFQMRIELCPVAGSGPSDTKPAGIILNLDDFFS